MPQGEAEAGAIYAALKDPARATDAGEAPIARIVVPAPASEAASRDERDPDEILQFEDMRVPRWIAETILRAAEATGVDPVYMMALADKESSFIPANKASTSSAEGLFQFIESTWLEMVKRFGAQHGLDDRGRCDRGPIGDLAIEDEAMREHMLNLRRDPYLSALMAAEMMKRDRGRVERRLGRPITRSEFYLAHFLGVDSASKFMSLLDDKPEAERAAQLPGGRAREQVAVLRQEGQEDAPALGRGGPPQARRDDRPAPRPLRGGRAVSPDHGGQAVGRGPRRPGQRAARASARDSRTAVAGVVGARSTKPPRAAGRRCCAMRTPMTAARKRRRHERRRTRTARRVPATCMAAAPGIGPRVTPAAQQKSSVETVGTIRSGSTRSHAWAMQTE